MAGSPGIYETYEPAVRNKLLTLRQLVIDVARQTKGVGKIVEAVKWGQPSFLTERPKSGSTIRIDTHGVDGRVAMYFICHTHLISRFRELYPTELEYEGDRAIVMEEPAEVDSSALKHCIATALSYHLAR